MSINIYDSFDTWDPTKWEIKRDGGGRVTIQVEEGRLVFRDTTTLTESAVAIIRSLKYFNLSKDNVYELRVDVEIPVPPSVAAPIAAYFLITPSFVTDDWTQDMYQIVFYYDTTGEFKAGVSAYKDGNTVFGCSAITVNKNSGTLRYVVLNDEIVFYIDDTEICRDIYRLGSREVAIWLETIMPGGSEVYWDNVAYLTPQPPSPAEILAQLLANLLLLLILLFLIGLLLWAFAV
jgi:hypothetical protein